MLKLLVFMLFLSLLILGDFSCCQQTFPRKSKVLPVLSWIIFPNNPCNGSNSTTGTCFSRNTCTYLGGNNTGNACAAGYGVCCNLFYSCGGVISRNNSYFVNIGYPESSSIQGRCVITVEKLNSNIEQIRLDFEEFALNGVTNRACEQDFLQVTGYDVNAIVPIFCGNNNGQHVYINVDSSRGPLTLATTTSGTGDRRWRIRVSQFPRRSPYKAPKGCLQYYTGPNGNFRSFNFDTGIVSGQSNYLSNLNYAICLRREEQFCGVQYVAPSVDAFSLAGPNEISTDTACASSSDALYLATSRYCGGSLASTPFNVTSTIAGQFRAVFTTSGVLPSGTYRGFNLNYQQTACS